MNRKFKINTLLFLIVILASCKNNSKNPDISNIEVDIQIERFENDLLNVDTSQMVKGIQALMDSYPEFSICYFENILGVTGVPDSVLTYIAGLEKIIKYGGFRAAFDSTMVKYGDLASIELELETTFRYFSYYFPQARIPKVVSFTSEYSYGAVTCSDTILAIGLDLYLGKDFTFYPMVGIPEYIIDRFETEYMVPNTIKAFITQAFRLDRTQPDLISHMLQNGKVLYIANLLMPDVEGHYKANFTKEQFAWCTENEGEIWDYLRSNELVYSTSRMEYIRYITDSPGIPGMPPAAPGNVGSWVGWQIVKSYMNRNPDVTIEMLILESDSQKILAGAGYKPKIG